MSAPARTPLRRRPLSAAEVGRLLDAAPSPAVARGYLLGALVGLRPAELAALRWADVDLERGLVRVASVKGRAATLPLAPDALAVLRSAYEQNAAAPVAEAAKSGQFRKDLERAGVERATEEGIADRHSLRLAFCAALARSGVPLAVAARLMRHSSPTVTSKKPPPPKRGRARRRRK